jgi:hypothetical protein
MEVRRFEKDEECRVENGASNRVDVGISGLATAMRRAL